MVNEPPRRYDICMQEKSRERGYVAIFLLLVTATIVAGLYFLQVPGLPVLPGMGTSTGNIISADFKAALDAKTVQGIENKRQQQIDAALKEY